MVSYTPILKLTQPDFDQVPWDEAINDDLAILDAAFGKFMVIPGFTGVWQNATPYQIGMMLVDSTDSSIWQCAVGHTSAAAPTTFAQDRAAHPTFWSSNSVPLNYLPIGGGTMTGPITLSGAPTAGGHATNKTYVDGVIGRAGGPFLSLATGGTVGGDVLSTGFELSDSHARIYSDSAYTYFVQTNANWYWRYAFATGTMAYISGSGVNLFQINGIGDIVAHGDISGVNIGAAGNIAVSGDVTVAHITKSGLFTIDTTVVDTTFPDFSIYRAGSPQGRYFQFSAGNYFWYNETTADLTWQILNTAAFQYKTSNNHLINYLGPMEGTSAYVITSDARVKHNVQSSSKGLDVVMALQPVSYMRKDVQEIGFIAQDVQTALPEAVCVSSMMVPDSDTPMLGMTIDPIVAVLVNAVKELQARIAVLEAK